MLVLGLIISLAFSTAIAADSNVNKTIQITDDRGRTIDLPYPCQRIVFLVENAMNTMKPGSVIVDMAAQAGGNCEYTVPGKLDVTASGVKVIGYSDLPGRLPAQSSEMYATNLVNLTKLLSKEKDGNINIDFEGILLSEGFI